MIKGTRHLLPRNMHVSTRAPNNERFPFSYRKIYEIGVGVPLPLAHNNAKKQGTTTMLKLCWQFLKNDNMKRTPFSCCQGSTPFRLMYTKKANSQGIRFILIFYCNYTNIIKDQKFQQLPQGE
eukprot:TRINITY_DN3483_c1_g1_i8.p5 TRINITY_DN3483_c1_g1~~TRINITY_DN3483_c1_g1_i8.p5  ORF type:complete len:123 (+),score=0.26 TRINITY_DN3483_c1_g1_i8:656-1024(+)